MSNNIPDFVNDFFQIPDLEEYEKLVQNAKHKKPGQSGRAKHSGEPRNKHTQELVPAKRAPKPRLEPQKAHPAPAREPAPDRNVEAKKITPQLPAPADTPAMENSKNKKRWKQLICKLPLADKISPPQPVWNSSDKAVLDNWKASGIGPEERKKAVEILTRFKQKGKNKLDLSGLALKDLPPVIFTMPIKELDISNNLLESLPANIGQLAQLVSLNASNNQLKAVPIELGDLSELKQLNLSYNKLNDSQPEPSSYKSTIALPRSFRKLKSLEELKLDKNEFKAVPVEIVDLNKLKTFSISKNQLTQAPDWMNRMPKLKHLNMANNQINKVSGIWDLLLKRLKTLDLSGNAIQELPFNAIPEKLKTLDLSDNPISSLPTTFGAILWAEAKSNGKEKFDQLKTTSRNRGNMRIIVQDTPLIAGLHNDGRLELRDENDSYAPPEDMLRVPRGGSMADSDFSDIDLRVLGASPLPRGGGIDLAGVEIQDNISSSGGSSNPVISEKTKEEFLKRMHEVQNWVKYHHQLLIND